MKILVFSLSYPNEYNKTASIFTKEQVDELSKTNEVVVAYVQMLPTRMILKKRKKGIIKEYDGVNEVYRIQMHTFLESKFPFINGLVYKFLANKLLKHICNQFQPDCIYAHFSIYAGWAAAVYGSKRGIPVVVEEHDGKLLSPKIDKTRKSMLSTTLKLCSDFICVSQKLKEKVLEFTSSSKSIHVIGNSVSPLYRYYPRISKDKFVFLCVANLYPGKNIDSLIRSFSLCFNGNPNVVLRVCGDGDCRPLIERTIIEEGMSNEVTLLGRQPRDVILNEFINCDCFVLPSDHETFGIVYREAMAIGRPIISTNHGGFAKDEIDSSLGIIVPVNDYHALETAMMTIYKEYGRFNLASISKKCLSNYDQKIIITRINAVLNDACNIRE